MSKQNRIPSDFPAAIDQLIIEVKDKSIYEFTKQELIEFADDINDAVYNANKKQESRYYKVVQPDKKGNLRNVISVKTLQRYVGKDPQYPKKLDLNDERTIKRLKAILICLSLEKEKNSKGSGIDPDDFKDIIFDNQNNKSLYRRLAGPWYVYMFDKQSNVVKQLPMYFTHNSEDPPTFTVDYRSIHNNIYHGTATVEHDHIYIELPGPNKIIHIHTYISEYILTGKMIFNAIGIGYIDLTCPQGSHLILIKQQNTQFRNVATIQSKKVVLVSKNKDNFDLKDNEAGSHDLNHVVLYLSRKKKITGLPFYAPNDYESIANRNKINFKKKRKINYEELKQHMKGEWYSFSSIPLPDKNSEREFALFKWDYEEDDHQKELTIIRHRNNKTTSREFRGTITYQNRFIFINLTDRNGLKKQLIALIALDKSDTKVLYGISSTVSDNSSIIEQIAVREILVKNPDFSEEERKKDTFTYEDLIKTKTLTQEQKLFLARRKDATLTYPLLNNNTNNFSDPYFRRKEATKYAGNYFVYLPNAYYPEKTTLLRLAVSIDILAQVVIKVFYYLENTFEKDDDAFIYYGQAEILNHTLRLSGDNDRGQRCEYIFNIWSDHFMVPDFIQGVTLDTDKKGHACADACIAIKTDLFNKGSKKTIPFLPATFQQGSNEYLVLESLMKEKIQTSPQDYFFKKFRSIREQINTTH